MIPTSNPLHFVEELRDWCKTVKDPLQLKEEDGAVAFFTPMKDHVLVVSVDTGVPYIFNVTVPTTPLVVGAAKVLIWVRLNHVLAKARQVTMECESKINRAPIGANPFGNVNLLLDRESAAQEEKETFSVPAPFATLYQFFLEVSKLFKDSITFTDIREKPEEKESKNGDKAGGNR